MRPRQCGIRRAPSTEQQSFKKVGLTCLREPRSVSGMALNTIMTFRLGECIRVLGAAIENTRNGVNTPCIAISPPSRSTDHGLLSFLLS